MLTYRHVGTYLGGRVPFVNTITDMQGAKTSDGYALYTVTQMGGGIASYRFSGADQLLQLTSTRAYAPSQSYLDTPGAALVQIGGKTAVFGTGLLNSVGTGFNLGNRGELGDQTALNGAGGLSADVTVLGSFQTPLGEFLFSARNNQTAFDTWRVNGDGSISHVDQGSLPWLPNQQGTEINDMLVAAIGDRNFMLSASSLGNYVSVQMIAGDGTLGQAQILWSDRGDGIAAPNHIGTVTVQGVTYLVVASGQSSSLTTMRIGYDGSLQPVDHVIDELTTRFSGASALETVMVDGRAYIFVGGRDDGISVFTVMPNGRLLHLATLADADDRSLADVAAISAVVIDGKIAVFVSSRTERGFTQFVFDPGQIGETRTAGAGEVDGTDRDDLLRAGEGTTVLRGGAGDDILIAGEASVELHGGDGADIFVPTAINGTITIGDFQLGTDRLDLSNLGMIRSVMQLGWSWRWDGIAILFGDTTIVIRTRDGTTLQSSDFTNALFPVAHYQPPQTPANLLGTDGDDTLTGGAGGAGIYGLAGQDLLTGGDGNDTLDGGLGNDTLIGGLGHDRLIGAAGNDRMLGGDGNDELRGGDGDDTLSGGTGDDSLFGYLGNDVIYGEDGDDHIEDWTGANRIWGGAGHDFIATGWGNDRIAGDGGNDTIRSGPGNDSIWGGDGDDSLIGGLGHDSITGGPGHDFLEGSDGNDTLDGSYGWDTLWGGLGNDRLFGGMGNDLLYGGMGYDIIFGGDGNDRIFGGAGNDSIAGGIGNDAIRGEDGNDVISGDAGADSIFGGLGNDTIHGNLDNDRLYGEAGHDLLIGGYGDDALWGQAGNDALHGGFGNDLLAGGDGNDRLYGDEGHDRMWGGTGNDRLEGGAGNDRLWGELGDDLLYGQRGNDILSGAAGNDRLYGNEDNDLLLGQDGHDLLDGGYGNDTIRGGTGNDTIRGGPGNDVLSGDAGNDRIFGSYGADWILGGAGNDALTGEQGYDSIAGGEGDDTIWGGTENDLLYGDAGDDSIFGGMGHDTLHGGLGNDHLGDTMGNNRLSGGMGNDTLIAGAGRDTLEGGAGYDSMTGGAGADLFLFDTRVSFDGAMDVITDFGNGFDRIDMRGLNLTFVGDAAFSGAGQVRSWAGPNGGFVAVDLNGDGNADLTISLGSHGAAAAGDFLL